MRHFVSLSILALAAGSVLYFIQHEQTTAAPASTTAAVPAASVYGMARAFDEGKVFVPLDKWTSSNRMQSEFIRDFLGLSKEARKLPKSMLDAVASTNDTVINRFLQQHGLTVRVQPFAAGMFGAAAVLTIEGKWRAIPSSIKADDGVTYSGIELMTTHFYKLPGHADPVVRIYSSQEFTVYVTAWNGDDSGFNAIRKARELTPDQHTADYPKQYARICMPMIDMDRTVRLDWLNNLSGNGYSVCEAVVQTRLKLDQNGFSVKEGFAFNAGESAFEGYELNKPFLLWVQVNGLSYPLFAVKVDIAYWKDPKLNSSK